MASIDRSGAPRILCAGVAVLDEVFRVEHFPRSEGKMQATGFFEVNGGCAANAALAIARLGGQAALASPFGGPAGEDAHGDRVLAALARENVDCSACQRMAGCSTGISAIFIDARGERMIVTYRDPRLAAAKPIDPNGLAASADAVLADNRYPDFVGPICKAARERGMTVVLDADKPAKQDDPLFQVATHVVFSAEALRGTTGLTDLATALTRMATFTDAFLAVTHGPEEMLWLEGATLRRQPAFQIEAVDTLGAGDVFHGAFTLALAEGRSVIEAMRFAAATAALKCARSGGSAATPRRAEVEAFLAAHA